MAVDAKRASGRRLGRTSPIPSRASCDRARGVKVPAAPSPTRAEVQISASFFSERPSSGRSTCHL